MNKEIISVVVLSYNSEKTIIETLDSILSQDYGSEFIELIVSDDASKDATQKITSEWLELHKNKFHKTLYNIYDYNTGIVNNFHSTCNKASSIWIKPIAADDILITNCLSEFLSFVKNHIEAQCVFCKVNRFNNISDLDVIPKNNYYYTLSAQEQFKNLLVDNFVAAPGCFIKSSCLKNVDISEFKDMSMEDYPLWLTLTKSNIPLFFLDNVLIKYRISNSLSNSSNRLINAKLNNDVYLCKKKFILKMNNNNFYKLLLVIDIKLFRLVDIIKIKVFKNKKNRYTTLISPVIRLLSPLYIIRKIKQKSSS